jgi:tetratricopeptide (TPR) repeat protein
VTQYQSDLAMTHDSIGLMKEQAGRLDEALESYERARAINEALTKAHPAVTLFQHFLARNQDGIGRVRLATGRLDEALESYERARAINEAVAKANPTSPVFQQNVAHEHTSIADVFRARGRLEEARAGYERAVAILEPLVKANSTYTPLRGLLARTTRRLGLARWAGGDTAAAVVDTRLALALFEGLPMRPVQSEYELACCHGALAGLAAAAGSGLSPGDGPIEAERAIAQLRRAVAAGYGNLAELRTETALDPLRSRPDFRLLMLDLAMPADPFARGR